MNHHTGTGRWRGLPATPEQRDYIYTLCEKAKVDPHLPPGLSRGDASDLIDYLQEIVDGSRPPGLPPLMALYAERKTVEAYRKSQAAQFGGKHQRPYPQGNRYGKVWKRHENMLRGGGLIQYGWSWRCSHPDHRQPVSANLGRYSFEAAWERMDAHNLRYHPLAVEDDEEL